MKFAFLSRHEPTEGQLELAKKKGIELVPIGDADAFSVDVEHIDNFGKFDGVVVVHPAAALRLSIDFIIGVFENGQRSLPGGKLTFEAEALHLYDHRLNHKHTKVTKNP